MPGLEVLPDRKTERMRRKKTAETRRSRKFVFVADVVDVVAVVDDGVGTVQ